MQPAVPSRTALRVALRRAAHQIFDAQPLVFADPLAVRIVGPYGAELHRTPGRPHLHPRRKPETVRMHSLSLRAYLVARSRYAEDLLASAIARGVRQYVLPGAGLDTFAHRNLNADLQVFEVDHPATQAWKRELLAAAALPDPATLHYAPLDFEAGSLAEALRVAGHDSGQPTFFAWLGVVPYLTAEAFRSTVAFLGGKPAGSGVVFDYSLPPEALSGFERLAHDSMAARVRAAGEPFQLFFTPEQLRAELAAYGLSLGEDLGAPEINARYFAGRSDGLRLLGSAGRFACAWVGSSG